MPFSGRCASQTNCWKATHNVFHNSYHHSSYCCCCHPTTHNSFIWQCPHSSQWCIHHLIIKNVLKPLISIIDHCCLVSLIFVSHVPFHIEFSPLHLFLVQPSHIFFADQTQISNSSFLQDSTIKLLPLQRQWYWQI